MLYSSYPFSTHFIWGCYFDCPILTYCFMSWWFYINWSFLFLCPLFLPIHLWIYFYLSCLNLPTLFSVPSFENLIPMPLFLIHLVLPHQFGNFSHCYCILTPPPLLVFCLLNENFIWLPCFNWIFCDYTISNLPSFFPPLSLDNLFCPIY